jgi:ABC-type sugar transport system permease subunit
MILSIGDRAKRLLRYRTALTAALLLLPYFLLFAFFKLGPLLINFWMSLNKLDIIGEGIFTGLANYRSLVQNRLFWVSFLNTLHYLSLVGPVNIIGGFFLALLLNQQLKGRIVSRTIIFMPYVIMVTVVGVIWRWLLDSRYGLVNYYLERLGLRAVPWLTSSSTAMVGIAMASVWWTIGYNTVIFLAALQEIPQDILDASSIDGAGPLRRLISIIVPGVRSAGNFVVLTTVIYSMQVFGQVYTMTGGGPQYSTVTLVHYLYITGFREFNLGYSSGMGVVLFLTVLLLSVIIFFLFRERAKS